MAVQNQGQQFSQGFPKVFLICIICNDARLSCILTDPPQQTHMSGMTLWMLPSRPLISRGTSILANSMLTGQIALLMRGLASSY
jgi:hypothetical protein